MKIFIIIFSIFLAILAGYLLRIVIESIKKEDIVFTKYFFNILPNYIINYISWFFVCICMTLFLLLIILDTF